MKKQTQKNQKKAKKTAMKSKKPTVKDLDAEKASQQIKGGDSLSYSSIKKEYKPN